MEKLKKTKKLVFIVFVSIISLNILAVPPTHTIKGTIYTDSGTRAGCNKIVPYVKVNIIDDNFWVDDLLASGWTDSEGKFSITFTWTDPDIDICVDIIGQSYLPDNKYVYIKDGQNTIYYEKVEDTIYEGPFPYGVTIDFGDLHLSDNKCNVLKKAGDALRYVKDNQASSTGWSVPQDLIAYPKDTSDGSFCSGDTITIEKRDWDDPSETSGGAFSDICHETAHFIMYNAYGNSWPLVAYTPPNGEHEDDTESSEGFALIEGFACYFAHVSHILDEKNDQPELKVWRGHDNKGDENQFSQTGMGEIVEGALMSIWHDINDFGKVLMPFVNDSPNSFYQWLEEYNNYGYNMTIALEKAQINGIIYSRGKMSLTETDPPNDTPKSDGNVKEINDVTFIRGEIVPIITALEKNVDLLLGTSASTFAIDKKKLGYKIVTTGPEDRDDDDTDILTFTYLAEENWADNIEFDTAPLKEGAYDLVVKTRNIHSWWDDLRYPSFLADGEIAKNTEEKWLKHLNTWYNQDTEAFDDDEGKVIIDNTPPDIPDASLKPAAN